MTAFVRHSPHRPFPAPCITPDQTGGSLPCLEKALITVTALHLCFLPWAFGAMHVWAQLVSLGFSLVELALVSIARTQTTGISETASACTRPAGRLVKFPLFWAGLALLVYVAVQALNPSWRFQSNEFSWWLEPADSIAWLPSGIDAPFVRSNAWRACIISASLWLLVCSIWTGFTRRLSYRLLFITLAANAFILALLGVLQELTGARRIFWSYIPGNVSFAASFIYRNHGAAYFNLMAALAVGLAWWHYQRRQRRQEKSGPAGLFALIAALAGFMTVLSSSRAAILLLFVFIATLAGVLSIRLITQKHARKTAEIVVLTLMLAGLLGAVIASLQTGRARQRFAELAANPTGASRDRMLARQAATEMLHDRWLLGWGAGCFRHGFPIYASRYPAIYDSNETGRRRFWEHAHNDLLQFPLELGLAGMIPLIGALGWCAWRLLRLRFWRNALTLPVMLGCALLFVHAGVDFVFQNPAILFTCAVLLVSMIRWLEFGPATEKRLPA